VIVDCLRATGIAFLVAASFALTCNRAVEEVCVQPAPPARESPPPPFQPLELSSDVAGDALMDASRRGVRLDVELKRTPDGKVEAKCAMTNVSDQDLMFTTHPNNSQSEFVWSEATLVP